MTSRDDRDDEPPREAESEPERPTEDRAAILSRRAFLIESALASAGITVGLAGCEREKQPVAPQKCLDIAAQKGLGVTPQKCLSVAPKMCLKVAPQPRVCLSERRDPKPPAARPCLEMMPPKRRGDGGA
jgi:hypothetical protein